ncbi:uncharacterized protein TNIN_176131 [Trichonephila inaurata madagascariensis]|uniref:Uncharacterized protein n=1 Tax=Trichonephila inaurata madagascariensis TaxID=2747483 RepID=A0A8X6X847_9ARAC|nr:uncharacterized protein TNIN_176131 [Trichonephila inaurata madagascariensis]
MIFRALFFVALLQVNLAATDKSNNGNSVEINQDPDYVYRTWNNSDYLTKTAVDEAIKKLMAFFIRHNSEVELSGPCMAAFFRAFQAIRKQTPWAYTCMYFNFFSF